MVASRPRPSRHGMGASAPVVLPAPAGAPRVEAAGSAATTGARPLQVTASAGPTRGASAVAAAPAPPHPPPASVEEGAARVQERRRPAGGPASSSGEEPLSPALQLAVAEELLYRLGTAQEKRELSDGELSLVKFLLDGMPTLEAAAGSCGERHSAPRWGFMVRAPVRWAGLRRAASRPRPPPSGGEPLAPALQLEIAKEVVSRLTSLVNFLEDRIPGLKAAASGVSGGAAQPLSKVAPSGRVPAKARRALAANLSPVATLRPGGKVATPAATAHCTVGQQVVTRHLGEGDAHATSGVHSKMPEANVGHEHHTGQESSSEDESLSSSSSSSSKEPLTPALLLEIAKELINGFTMAQEYRMLSTSEQSLVKFLEGRIPGLEAEVASEVCSGGETLSPSKVASSGQACLKAKARRVIVSILSRPENTLIRPGLSAPLVHPPSHQVAAPLVNPRSHQVAAPAAYVTVDQQVITRYSGEEDAYTSSGVDNKMPEANASHEHHTGQELSSEDESLSSSSSSSSKEPLTPALLLEIAKDLINGLTMAQEKRMLSTDEHSLIKFLEDRIPGLEAEIASEVCGGGETLSPSKVASSGHACLQAEARHVIATILSRPATTLFRPGLSASLVHPLFHQVAAPAAYVTIDQQVVTRFSGEEDAYATSGVHNKMPDASVSHDHGRGQELSSEYDSGCDLGIVTKKSSTTIAPETAPPPSDGDSTAESSGISNRWGTAPEAKDFDDLGLPDDLGIY